MPRRTRPSSATRSEHWLRTAVKNAYALDHAVKTAFGWDQSEAIDWVSPVKADNFAEYYDEAFLKRLGIASLKCPLDSFWPKSGPRWDALARTASGKYLLVEAKAYIEEGVDYCSKAGPNSMRQIRASLEDAKNAFGCPKEAPWESPFYQYANRLAHLYFLAQTNEVDAYLLFLYFADAPDVPNPCSVAEWKGAVRTTEKCLGLGSHPFRSRIKTIIWTVPDLIAGRSPKP